MQKIIRNVAVILIVVVVILIIITNVENALTANAIKEQKEQEAYEDELVDNCDCIERERWKCSEGFELIGRNCKSDGKWTNVLLGCSKYNCSDEIHEFNFDTEKWEIEVN